MVLFCGRQRCICTQVRRWMELLKIRSQEEVRAVSKGTPDSDSEQAGAHKRLKRLALNTAFSRLQRAS